MKGIDSNTGKRLADLAHLRQSIRDILTTPIGSRVMRRDYGSRLFELIDNPTNRETILEIYVATAEALRKWEPRIRVTDVRAASAEPGRVTLDVIGEYLPDGKEVKVSGIEVN